MKKILSVILFSFALITAKADDANVARELTQRLIPEHASSFIFEKINDAQIDKFEIESRGEKIIIRGNNANSMAVGLNHYLKYYCLTNVSWFVDDEINMPSTLPIVPQKISVDARCKNRFFLNYCTFGYTMTWWTWRDWEHFIDWMALNGINLPLAITGQEAIWHRVWQKLGLTDEEIRAYFTGPAHLPWHRMLNIDRWQGPLPQSWLDNQEELQKKIVARERELNMKPVLPAFSGHVPADLKRIFPDAKISELSIWGKFSPQYRSSFLDPMDALFSKIQKIFIDEQTEIFGSDHIYGLDLFNELQPPSWEPDYLARVSKQVYESLAAADSEAVWLQMTWLFYYKRNDWTADRVKAYITAFQNDRSLLLDYYCERMEVWQRTDKFFGVPYIWCYLGNFGGNTMLMGNIKEVNKRIENTLINGGNNFSGIGSTLEGFDCNPFMYEFVFEKAWNFNTHNNIDNWVERLADQRIHKINQNQRDAWKLLIDSAYNHFARPGQCPLINVRPTLGKLKGYSNTRINYSNKTLVRVLDLMLSADGSGSAYTFDVVNIARQILGNYFTDVYKQYCKAYIVDKNKDAMIRYKNLMLEILNDSERLLSSNSAFLLGKWIDDARKIGVNDEEKLYYERNARNILSTWGEKNNQLNDYASRTWAGLTATYYAERWKMFFDEIEKSLDENLYFTEVEFHKNVTDFEEKWWKDCIGNFNEKPVGNGIEIAREILNKYKGLIKN